MLYGHERDSGLWLAGGKQKQWGYKGWTDGSYSITFPIAFPSECYVVVDSAAATSDSNFQVSTVTKTGFSGWTADCNSARYAALGK